MLNKQKYLACICEKRTRKMLSAIFEVEAENEYYLIDELELLTGLGIDGITNYIDWVLI